MMMIYYCIRIKSLLYFIGGMQWRRRSHSGRFSVIYQCVFVFIKKSRGDYMTIIYIYIWYVWTSNIGCHKKKRIFPNTQRITLYYKYITYNNDECIRCSILFWVRDMLCSPLAHYDYYTMCRTSMRYIYAGESHLFPSVICV